MKIRPSIAIVALLWIVVATGGSYLTFVRQPERLDYLDKAEQVANMKRAELVSLQSEQTALYEEGDEIVRKWGSRYKVIPQGLTTADVVGYLTRLTQAGFKNFDLNYVGSARNDGFSVYTFQVTGRAYHSSLYRFVWNIENSRTFCRVRSLDMNHIDLITEDRRTSAPRLEVLVSFTMYLDAYFDPMDGLSAPSEELEVISEGDGIALRTRDLPSVPLELLPATHLPVNPFYPGILKQIPPNTHGLVDVEEAEFVSIVDGKAAFKDDRGFRLVGVGESVYLGQIIEVDPLEGRVVARLNKGGIVDEVERELDLGEDFRRAEGRQRLTPVHK